MSVDPRNTTLTILSGQTSSPELLLTYQSGQAAWAMTFIAPGSLAETVNIQVAAVSGGVFGILRTSLTDIVLAAGRADQVIIISPVVLKLVSTSPVSGDKVFTLCGVPYFMKSG